MKHIFTSVTLATLLLAPSLLAQKPIQVEPKQDQGATQVNTNLKLKDPSYPASYYRLKSMSVGVPMCLDAAEKAVRKSQANGVKLYGIKRGSSEVGGYTTTTRGYIVCVRLPGDGDCNGDGATAVIVAAGADAKELAGNLYANLIPPTLIDCGSAGNPVNR